MGLVGGLLSAGLGSGGNGQDLTNLLTEYQGEQGGVDLVAWSGGAQTVSTVLQDNPSLSTNVVSTTYLSPGLNLFSGNLYQASDSLSFKGSGVLDFGATLRARLTGVQLKSTGTKGHNFVKEFESSGVQNRINSFPGSRGVCTGGPQGGGADGSRSGNGDDGFYGNPFGNVDGGGPNWCVIILAATGVDFCGGNWHQTK